MSAAMLAPGTYRTADGGLLHARDDSRGRPIYEIECADGRRVARAVLDDGDAVLLSDDPSWPWHEPVRIAVLVVD